VWSSNGVYRHGSHLLSVNVVYYPVSDLELHTVVSCLTSLRSQQYQLQNVDRFFSKPDPNSFVSE
jgi:hypothetical protein